MNCQDIARILDDQDIAALSAVDQQQAKLHLASCHECARDWELHAQLAASVMPAFPQELRASCRSLVMAGSGVARARTRSRLILVSTLAVVAAAAAMLGLQWPGSSQPSEVAAAPAPNELVPATAVPASVDTQAVESQEKPEEAPAAKLLPPEAAPSFTVAVLPLIHDSDPPAHRQTIDSFHASLLAELRRIPGLVLVDSRAEAQYRVTVRGLAADAPATAGSQLFPNAGMPPGGSWRVEVVVDVAGKKLGEGHSVTQSANEVQSASISSSAADSRYVGLVGAVTVGNCAATATQQAKSPGSCSEPAQLAASQVATLRARLFPPDASFQRNFLAQLQDPQLPEEARTRASMQLQILLSNRRIVWDAATIRTFFDMAVEGADPRFFSWWGALRGVRSPDLVQPLLGALRNGADEKVRLGAMSLLRLDYASLPEVRAAFEIVARDDPRELVRQEAQRILYGDAGWRNYVVATLGNTSLTDDARLAPLAYMAQSRDHTAQLPAVMDATAVAALTNMLPRLWSNPEHTQAVVRVLDQLGRAGHPGAVGLVSDALRNAPENALMSLVSGLAASRLRDDPAIQEALDAAAAANPRSRALIEGMRKAAPPR
jgi:hypothetical protein